ncbi:glycosyltransferase family 2 protein [Maribacter sp. LLG6340-A2]|uniref:glycosyltransferase family 2 protein n=1 Tax=Maribacter sp. LLG6340-A2 TaxID=3160834 RepID=UPI00386C4837
MISALILTYNEENILEKNLKNLDFVDHILIFDSYSTDQTIEISKAFNATVIQRKFDNYASQRNAALDSIPKEYEWILMIDADEIVTPELRDEIIAKTSIPNSNTMYRVRRKDMFRDKWIKQSSGYPTWFPRLFKNGCVKVEREINEEYVTTGKEALLDNHLIHYPFNKGMHWWFAKHNKYSQMEAIKMLEEMKEPFDYKLLFSKDPIKKRKAQKRLSYKIPFRPQFVFFAFFILKRGFLNGSAGYEFCKLRKTYEYMIQVKVDELKYENQNFLI